MWAHLPPFNTTYNPLGWLWPQALQACRELRAIPHPSLSPCTPCPRCPVPKCHLNNPGGASSTAPSARAAEPPPGLGGPGAGGSHDGAAEPSPILGSPLEDPWAGLSHGGAAEPPPGLWSLGRGLTGWCSRTIPGFWGSLGSHGGENHQNHPRFWAAPGQGSPHMMVQRFLRSAPWKRMVVWTCLQRAQPTLLRSSLKSSRMCQLYLAEHSM